MVGEKQLGYIALESMYRVYYKPEIQSTYIHLMDSGEVNMKEYKFKYCVRITYQDILCIEGRGKGWRPTSHGNQSKHLKHLCKKRWPVNLIEVSFLAIIAIQYSQRSVSQNHENTYNCNVVKQGLSIYHEYTHLWYLCRTIHIWCICYILQFVNLCEVTHLHIAVLVWYY